VSRLFNRYMTILEARRILQRHVVPGSPGVVCPVCGEHCVVRPRSLTHTIARSLIWLVNAYENARDWIDVQRGAPDFVLKSREFDKLRLWGLAESKPNVDPKKTGSALWRPTQAGTDFVDGRTTIPTPLHVFRNEVRGAGKKKVDIQECLGEEFDVRNLRNPTVD
jgi:hypothetical protein